MQSINQLRFGYLIHIGKTRQNPACPLFAKSILVLVLKDLTECGIHTILVFLDILTFLIPATNRNLSPHDKKLEEETKRRT